MEQNLNLNIFPLPFFSPLSCTSTGNFAKKLELLIQNQNNTYTFKLKDFNH